MGKKINDIMIFTVGINFGGVIGGILMQNLAVLVLCLINLITYFYDVFFD